MPKYNHLGPDVRAWAKVHSYEVTASIGINSTPEDQQESDEGFYPIWLVFQGGRGGGRKVIHLTGMTSEELDAMEKVIAIAFAEARKIVAVLDQAADDTLMKDPYVDQVPMRALRSDPPFFERPNLDARMKTEPLTPDG